MFRAFAPYGVIIAVLALAQIPFVKSALAGATRTFSWPGPRLLTANGEPSTLPVFKFDWLATGGSLLIVAGLITMPLIGIGAHRAWAPYLATHRQPAAAIVTVMAVLALAYVMNASGQTATLDTWLAGAGAFFTVLSPILGWIGVAVTGSDTSSGGVLGKMISPQNLAIAAAAVGMSGREGDLFRKVLLWSIGFLALMCVLVYPQSTPVLSWMVQ